MRVRYLIALAALAVLLFGGCGRSDDSTPVACLEGTEAYLRALEAAPGHVLLGDETPIGDCLTEAQEGGALATVGTATVEAATELNAEARAEPGGEANLQLGYLIGAVRRGAEGTEGIHSDLERRLLAAARFAPGREPLSQQFLETYARGFDAGREGG